MVHAKLVSLISISTLNPRLGPSDMMTPRSLFLRLLLITSLLFAAGCGKRNKKPTLDPSLAGADAFGSDLDGAFGGTPLDGDFALGGRGDWSNKTVVDSSALAPVYFAYDSSSVAPGETYKLQMVAQHLRANPRDVVIVEGHCDERGSREYNLALGERRALAVRGSLISLGISADRIQTRSYGEEMPAVQGFDESAYAQNRRAEFQILR